MRPGRTSTLVAELEARAAPDGGTHRGERIEDVAADPLGEPDGVPADAFARVDEVPESVAAHAGRAGNTGTDTDADFHDII